MKAFEYELQRTMIRNTAHRDHHKSLQSNTNRLDVQTVRIMKISEPELHTSSHVLTHLKLAVSTQAHPSFTTHGAAALANDNPSVAFNDTKHGSVLSGIR